MLGENIKNLRKAKGLSQEELACELNVVRQTVSKWEKDMSVPDAGMLIAIAKALDTTVNVLLGEEIPEPEEKSEVKILAEKLEAINGMLAAQAERRRRIWRGIFVVTCICSLWFAVKQVIYFLNGLSVNSSIQYSSGIIGGADGPTSILISAAVPDVIRIIAILALLIISAAGIYGTRRR